MDTCEVLIIGGGPAGSTCAGRLGQAGLDVLLIDARVFPRDKPCAGWITPAVLETLAVDVDEYRQGRVLQDIQGFVTGVMNGTEVATRYDRTVSYGIRRREFDHYLLQRSSVRQVLGEPVTSLVRSGGGWIVNGRIRARLVVGAGGHSCPAARFLGAKIGAEEVIVAQSAEFSMAGDPARVTLVRDDTPELFFTRDMKGYGWIFRKGEFLNVGFGRRGKGGFARQMAEFRALLERRGVVASGVTYEGHAYRAWQQGGGRNRVGDGVLLIGDAAGLAYPESGEGILPAIESAMLAAETILTARGDYRRDNLELYAARLRQRHGGGWRGVPLSVPAGLVAPIGARLLAMPPFVRHVVLDRWFLHAGQRPLSM